ncbi:hypothetical protein V6N13_026587 [Hibiscus sabdariffa]
MNEINKTLPQLLGMLRTVKSVLKKNGSKSILIVREAKGKRKTKSKGNGKSKPKGKDALKPEKGISKDGKCFHCDKSGHWRRNCPLFLEEVKKKPLKRRILAKGNMDLQAGNGARVAALAIGTCISLIRLD